MSYQEIELAFSKQRLSRFLLACKNDEAKALVLYAQNLLLTQKLFTVISCFEVALRNQIDKVYSAAKGPDWIADSISQNGMFAGKKNTITSDVIKKGLRKLGHHYSHGKLIAEMDFGWWRYQLAGPQFTAGGQILLRAFPNKPPSTPSKKINNKYFFDELVPLNDIRNRLAHHEPICFKKGSNEICSQSVRGEYYRIADLLNYMGLSLATMLIGLDKVLDCCDHLDNLK